MSVLERIGQAKNFKEVPCDPALGDFAKRWNAPSRYAEGCEDGYQADGELVVTTKKLKMRAACREFQSGIGRLVFVYHLDGHRTVRFRGPGEYRLNRPAFVAYYQPEGLDQSSHWEAGQSEMAVCLGFNPLDPPKVLESAAKRISLVGELLDNSVNEFKWIQLELSQEMANVARSLMFLNTKSAFLQEYIAAKSNELLCVTLDRLDKFEDKGQVQHLPLDAKLQRIKDTLEQEIRCKPSIDGFASEYCIPKRLVNQAFEEKYGLTVQEYSALIRMSKSVQLLCCTEMPLKQIAYEVGYDHVSNFCLAFKKRYGHTPKSVRSNAADKAIYERLLTR